MVSRPSADSTFRAVFEASPCPMLLTDDDAHYIGANPAACHLLQRTHDELLDLTLDDLTPPGANFEAVWGAFIAEGEMAGDHTLRRRDGSVVEVEFYAKANVIPGKHLAIVQDVTARKQAERARDDARHVALSLQRAMLPTAIAVEGLDVAARYLPATEATAVGGDWYDVVDLGERCVAVTIGDVMGHGLAAAGIMGRLHSALSAALHGHRSPARAIETLDAYARSVSEPAIATVFAGQLDLDRGTLSYSNAGHLPPLLVGDSSRFLDQATAPLLTATTDVDPRPEATVRLPGHATLVLYTDGLVEHRHQDIDEGLRHLADTAKALADEECGPFADALLEELRPRESYARDDVALLVLRI
jgi:PAS domain S-box-containing protein